MKLKAWKKKHILLAALLLLALFFLSSRFIWSKEARIKRWRHDAAEAYKSGDFAEAARFYDHALNIDPQDKISLAGRARSGMKIGERSIVKGCLDALEKQSGDSPEYKQLLYEYALHEKNYALAASLLDNLPAYEPAQDEYLAIIRGLFDEAYYTQADKLLAEARKKYPKDRKFAELGVMTAVKLDKAAEALSIYDTFEPDLDCDYLNYLADAYLAEDKKEKALQLWSVSLEQNINQEAVVKKLLELLAETGQSKEYCEWRQVFLRSRFVLPAGKINIFGNSPANVRYRGFAAQQNGCSYLADPDGSGLYRISESSMKTELIKRNIQAMSLNIRGDRLYFVDRAEHHALKCLRLDDGAIATLCADQVKAPLVWGDIIFFINETDGQRLYRLDQKSGELTALTEIGVKEFAPDGEYIYFISEGEQDLYRQKQDSRESERLLLGSFSDINVDEFSQIYMLDADLKGIVTCQPNGSHKTLLLETEADYLNYANNKLYYVQWTPHSVDKDGREAKSLASNFSSELIICGDWIYSYAEKSESEAPAIYRFRPDGTDWTVVSFEAD